MSQDPNSRDAAREASQAGTVLTDTTDQQAVTVAPEDRNSIYAIKRGSPSFTWPEREAVTEDAIDAALGAYVPGGASVYCWLPMADGHTIHQTARDVMRSAIAGLDKHRIASVSSASAGMKPWRGGDVRPADWNPTGDAIMVDPSDMLATQPATSQEGEGQAFRPMDTWDCRDEIVMLLVDYREDGDNALDDADIAITVGHNNDHNVGEGEGQGWQFAGWCWAHDHYVEGKGKPVGWLPLPHHLVKGFSL